MTKEESIIDFLKGLHIALNNSFAYSKEHPYFRKSVEAFKQKLDGIFPLLNPITINVAPDSLFIDGKYWQKSTLYGELAQLFHLRKIKTIEFRSGITTDELIDFLKRVSLPIKEFLRLGGFKSILDNAKTQHLAVRELDYSQLLGVAGEESKDIWVYLFKEAAQKQDYIRLNDFADNFEKIIAPFRVKDLAQDEELRKNLADFLNLLKEKEKSRFYRCTKAIFKMAINEKDAVDEGQLDRIKVFFKDLNKEDLAEALLEEVFNQDNFNYLSLSVFSRIFDENTQKKTAPLLEEKIKTSEFIKNNPKIIKKVKELFSSPQASIIPPLYQGALSWLAKEHISENRLIFDRELLKVNYRFLLLNMLYQEKNQQTLNLISGQLLIELKLVTEERNLESLKFIWEALDKKIKEDPSLEAILEGVEGQISGFVENEFFQEEPLKGLEFFTDKLRKSYVGLNFYLGKIFNEGKVNPDVLKLLFKFFADELSDVYESLQKRHADMDFLLKVVQCLENVDSPASIEMLKRIFNFSNNLVKIEVLRAMQSSGSPDREFLLSVLRKEDPLLQKEAIMILTKHPDLRELALEEFLFIPSPWGRNNNILIEHIRIIQDIGLRGAVDSLKRLSQRRFFWNKNLRDKALEVLRSWNVS